MDETGGSLIPQRFRIEFLGRRRDVLALLSGAVAGFPLPTLAQQQLPVIGILSSRSRATDPLLLAVIRQGLNDTGFVEGRNVAIEYRWAEGKYDGSLHWPPILSAGRLQLSLPSAVMFLRLQPRLQPPPYPCSLPSQRIRFAARWSP